MKVSILTDTSCGISRKEINEMGIKMISLPFLLDEIEYNEDNLDKECFYIKLKQSKDIHTSTANLADVTSAISELLEESDIVMYFPITSGLSSAYANSLHLLEESKFKNKLIIVNHKTISILQRAMLNDVKKLLDANVPPLEIQQKVEENAKNNRIYIAVDTLEYLKRGGRINSVSATIGSVLNIKPVLFSNGNKFEIVKKARGFKAAQDCLIECVNNDLDNIFKDLAIDKLSLGVAYTKCIDEARSFKERVEALFNTNFSLDELSTVIGCHIGEGAMALGVYKKIYEN